MGVSVCDDGVVRYRRQIAAVVDVSVGEEEAGVFQVQFGVAAHNGKLQHHLVYFAVAVPPDCQQRAFSVVEQFGDLLRIVEIRNSVARSVVEQIAQSHQAVGVETVSVFKQFFEGAA